MTRRETAALKGVAILFMVWLHLFNHIDSYESVFTISHRPLANFLSRATNPVSFFCLLGGYGLYSVYTKGDKHRYSRVFKLFVHFWIILIAFVALGHSIRPSRYPGTAYEFFCNFLAFDTSYNGEWWFLLPYVCLSISSKYLFRIADRVRVRYVLISTYVLSLATGFVISRYGEAHLYNNHLIYNPLLFFHLLPAFMWGAMMKRSGLIEHTRRFVQTRGIRSAYLHIALTVIFLAYCACGHTAIHIFYISTFLVIFAVASKWEWLNKGLEILGNHSMNIWLVHTILCYYLFHDFIYSFHYPLIIFLVTLLLSLGCSYVVNFIANPIVRRI